jgi:hypothetical protein
MFQAAADCAYVTTSRDHSTATVWFVGVLAAGDPVGEAWARVTTHDGAPPVLPVVNQNSIQEESFSLGGAALLRRLSGASRPSLRRC